MAHLRCKIEYKLVTHRFDVCRSSYLLYVLDFEIEVTKSKETASSILVQKNAREIYFNTHKILNKYDFMKTFCHTC